MITKNAFPILEYDRVYKTRDTIQSYAKVVGAIRAQMTPEQKEYWHISLRAAPQGFRTTPISYGDGDTFEIAINLISHSAQITTSTGHSRNIALTGQSVAEFSSDLLSILNTMNIKPELDLEKFKDTSKTEYDQAAASEIFKSYSLVDIIFKTFKGTIDSETSPVQLWTHHMDIAFTTHPGKDTKNLDQIGFGYLIGDEAVTEPYFYITAYPEIEDTSNITLKEHAYWNPDGWQGVVLKYKDLIANGNPAEFLINHLDKTYDQILDITK
ncbi:MAG: DUF5996 family protein [Thermodesulfobacteriota bacterium]